MRSKELLGAWKWDINFDSGNFFFIEISVDKVLTEMTSMFSRLPAFILGGGERCVVKFAVSFSRAFFICSILITIGMQLFHNILGFYQYQFQDMVDEVEIRGDHGAGVPQIELTAQYFKIGALQLEPIVQCPEVQVGWNTSVRTNRAVSQGTGIMNFR